MLHQFMRQFIAWPKGKSSLYVDCIQCCIASNKCLTHEKTSYTIEDENNNNQHNFPDGKKQLHLQD